MKNMRKKKQQKELKGSYPQVLPDKMTYAQTALFLDVSVRTLHTWVKRGSVPHYRVGRRVYFIEADLLRWIETCRVEVVE